MRNNVNTDLWLCRIGFGLIFCYCFAASIYYSFFAQLHLTLPFLPFPIFIGEILLFICLMIFLSVSKGSKLFDHQSILLLGLYFGWVLVKASINYFYDGPLTCRNAALFYYPIFAVFAYCFYQKIEISYLMLISLAFLAACVMFFKLINVWCWWTYVTLYVIAVWNMRSIKLRWFGWAFLAVIFLSGKEYLYAGPRAHFVSVFGAVLFLVFYFGSLFVKRRNYIPLSILFVSFLVFIAGFFVISNKNDIRSVTSFKSMISTYNAFDKLYQAQQGKFVPEKLSVHLYNPKSFGDIFPHSPSAAPQIAVTGPVLHTVSSNTEKFLLPKWMKKDLKKDVLRSRIREGRPLDLNENNIVFRLFVWRDMARELIEQRAWWGFSFGHPQRSKSLEVLHWAESEWSRDGWITPHNSFFHVIYRAGILGILLIGILFFMVGKLTRDFLVMGSIEGGFLVGGLVYWLVLSNFFVILEFPYNAIVFWTLFGITWAYRENLQAKVI